MELVTARSTLPARDYASRPPVRRRWLRELAELLAFPTIAGAGRHRGDIAAAARWLADHLRGIGLTRAEVLPGAAGGQPSVYAAREDAPTRPTLLIYGHFDVQDPGDPAAWRTPPFRATLRGDRLYARGASDDKGQFFAQLKALESWLAATGSLPLNVKVWLEAEEELGSPTLGPFLDREATRLRADALLASDTAMPGIGRPALVIGLRGLARLRLVVQARGTDLHAGRYGGAVVNPLAVLCRLVAGLHDAWGRIVVPGVRVATGCRRDPELPGHTPIERAAWHPALNVTAIDSGPGGTIPAVAAALLDLRLVPGQEADAAIALLRRHVARAAPPGVAVRLDRLTTAAPASISPDSPALAAARRAITAVWGRPPVLVRSGGSIPAVAALQRRLGVQPVLLGLGLPEDRAHGANESLALGQFFRGVATGIQFLPALAAETRDVGTRGAFAVGRPR